MGDLADDAERQGGVGIDDPAGQAQLARHRRGQRRPRGGVGRRDPASQLREAERRGLRGDAQVAEQRQREPARHRGPLTAASSGRAQRRTASNAATLDSTRRSRCVAVAAELAHVHARAEGGSGAREDDRANAGVIREPRQRVGDLLAQLDGQRVAALGAPEGHERHGVPVLDRQEAGHRAIVVAGAPLGRVRTRSTASAGPWIEWRGLGVGSPS